LGSYAAVLEFEHSSADFHFKFVNHFLFCFYFSTHMYSQGRRPEPSPQNGTDTCA
jgi:hypothetical protein